MEVGIIGGRTRIRRKKRDSMEGVKMGNVFIDWRRRGVDENGGAVKEKNGEGERMAARGVQGSDWFRESTSRDCVSEANGWLGSEMYERSMAEKGGEVVREGMFEKAVTPSDVGKLNRLVIPKHHAEKYFPLDTSANDKGLLLSFEDSTGKTWRFRYSYWNSSQSYVLTKGWSRFVKEKKLEAGDIVSFQRSTDAQNAERLYITWKRRPPPPPHSTLQIHPGGAKASLLRRLSLPPPTFHYGALPLQSQALIRAASSPYPKDWMSVVWQHSNVGGDAAGAFWRLPKEEPSRVTTRCLTAAEQCSGKEPHDFMQLKVTSDRSSPVENAGDLSSKKGVRLFGVNL